MVTTLATDPDRLVGIIRRLPLLEALHRDALRREELERRLDVSTVTCYRYLNWFSDMELLDDSSEEIALTSAGEVVAEEAVRFETAVLPTLEESERDREFLPEVIRHAPALGALGDGPRDRREVEHHLDISKSTSYRATRTLEDLELIEKSRGRYTLTPTGEEVWEAVTTFETNVRTALRLGPLLGTMRDTRPSFDLEALADATLTTPKQGDVHSPVNRFITIATGTDSLRGVDMHSIAPLYVRDINQLVVDGMQMEAVMKPIVVATCLAELPDEIIEVCRSDNMKIHLHSDPPCSLVIVDDRVGIGVRDTAVRTPPMFVDTDSPSVREWTETVFESCREDAVRLEDFTPWDLRQTMEDESLDSAGIVDS